MLPELLSLPPAELARRLATVAVEARARKVAAAKRAAGMLDQAVAGAKGLWSSAQPTLQAYGNSLKNMDVSNPAVAATIGAAALGGGSAISEAFRSKDRRRWSNVGLNAALGGLLGGAAPTAIAGIREYLNVPDAQKSLSGTVPGAVVENVGTAGQIATGGFRKLRDLAKATGVDYAPVNSALDVGEYFAGGVRDNPAGTIGLAGTAALTRNNRLWAQRHDLERGLAHLTTGGLAPADAAKKLLGPEPKAPVLESGPPQPISQETLIDLRRGKVDTADLLGPGPLKPTPPAAPVNPDLVAQLEHAKAMQEYKNQLAQYDAAAAAHKADRHAYDTAQRAKAIDRNARNALATGRHEDALKAREQRAQGVKDWAGQSGWARGKAAPGWRGVIGESAALHDGFRLPVKGNENRAMAADFRQLRASAPPSSFFGRTVPRVVANISPLVAGALLDYLRQANK